jgi:flagellar motor switch protein FliN
LEQYIMSSSNTKNSPAAQTQLVELPELAAGAPGATLLSANAGLLDGVNISLSVVVGQVQTTLGALMALRESAVLTVDRGVDAPVDVVVNGNVVARGQLVVVGDSFGVRVTDVALASAP